MGYYSETNKPEKITYKKKMGRNIQKRKKLQNMIDVSKRPKDVKFQFEKVHV